MEYFGLLAIAAAIWYLAVQVRVANRLKLARLEFDQWNAGWSKERQDEFEAHIKERSR